MSDKRYLGNIITQNPTAPAGNFENSAAKGVWSLEEQLAYQKAGLWPVPGNLPLNVEEVFSTYLYEGNGSTQTITNGIDLDGEGGLVWIKNRDQADNHRLHDTVRGNPQNTLITNLTLAAFDQANSVTGFNSNGFDIGSYSQVNTSGEDFCSWTFRKAPKFFDVVTYTGDNSGNVVKSHNLGSTPGMIIIKNLDSNTGWDVFHRSLTSGLGTGRVFLDNTNAEDNTSIQFLTADSSSITLTHSIVKTGGENYVAYLFAHNDGDGEFGPDGDADIIKCGSYTGNGSATGPSVNLGFEPQWLLIRNVDRADDWVLIDAMRGIPSSSDGPAVLRPESSAAEYASGSTFSQASRVDLTATGFDVKSSNSRVNGSSQNMIYMAIRRPTAVPESATDVFGISYAQNVNAVPFPVDFMLYKIYGGGNTYARDRLRGGTKYLLTETTNADLTGSDIGFDDMTGNTSVWGTSFINYNWKRAPKYMDVVAYSGFLSNGATGTIPHNLSVAPELMIFKNRSSSYGWYTWHTDLTAQHFIQLNSNAAETNFGAAWATADENNINIGFGHQSTSLTGNTYISYLFATLAGISKVGSVTHSGTTNVDCGFTSGARFVLLKRTDATGDWYVWDSERGIVAGNDPYFLLNTTAAQVTNTDYIDPLASGFTITSSFTAGDYIFYAIA